MASQAQKKEATEMSEKELANAEEIGDRDAGKQAEDAPNFESADLGKSATLMAFYLSFSERFEQCTWSSLITCQKFAIQWLYVKTSYLCKVLIVSVALFTSVNLDGLLQNRKIVAI